MADNWGGIMTALTDVTSTQVSGAGAAQKAARSSRIDIDEYEKWEEMVKNDWSDGLPVALPTSRKVDAILNYLKRDPAEVLRVIPPAMGVANRRCSAGAVRC